MFYIQCVNSIKKYKQCKIYVKCVNKFKYVDNVKCVNKVKCVQMYTIHRTYLKTLWVIDTMSNIVCRKRKVC